MLVAEAGAGQDHRRQFGVGQVDGHAGRYQHRLAGHDGHLGVDGGAQVQPGRAAGGVGRQVVLQAGVEDLNVDGGFHALTRFMG
ncbi:hypothetical protein D3C78_1880930 [compost metagenome]